MHCDAWLSLLAEDFGLSHYDEHWFEQWIGTSDKEVAQDVIEEHGLDLTVSELTQRKQERFHAAVRDNGKTFPGVETALAKIAGRFPLAIATNSGRADADLMIESTRLDRFTEISVTASDVDQLKPAPDIYLLAAERLGIPPENCIAIEDSGPGGRAAKAAGCYLIGLTDKVTVADEMVTSNEAALLRALALLEA